MKLTFWGAARQVTGSMHLLELNNGYRILVDCGLDYDQMKLFHNNPPADFPFEPASINAVLLTHAHIDHSGNLPNLVRQGFSGHIFCTPATADLINYLLADSAAIQLNDNRKKNKGKKGKKKATGQPLYLQKHVMDTMEQVVTVNFNKKFNPVNNVEVQFIGAGHLLGAASILVKVEEDGVSKSIGFTGDIGKINSQLLEDPQIMDQPDYLVTESTYAGRKHKVTATPEEEMLMHVVKACVDQPGRLIIPAFSVGRTQGIVYTLRKLYQQGKLPRVRVFVDSPLAIKTTAIFPHYISELNEEARTEYAKTGELFDFEYLEMVMDQDGSEEIKYCYEPCVIISAAGMVEGGRIQEHIRNNIQNPFATVLIAGYCAEGTLGHRLLLGQPTVQINKKEVQIFAKISNTDVFSGHADHDALVDYVKDTGGTKLKKVFIVHGEEKSMFLFKDALEKEGMNAVFVPEKGDSFEL
jgi:metallo-beta-lactamase family protein